MKIKNIVSAQQFDKETIQTIFSVTDKVKSGNYNKNALSGKIMASLFYEASTRTRLSFESAILKLGGSYIATENAAEFSSAIKGETLGDTIRIINTYSDIIVLRHPKSGSAELAAKYSKDPIINAGDGSEEHPTQALLDLYTIFSRFDRKNLIVAMIGDLMNGRTIHSLARLISLYPSIEIIFVSPKNLAIPKKLRDFLTRKGTKYIETENFTDGIKEADVIYQTRIQKERFKKMSEYKKFFGKYIIDKKTLRLIKKNAIILHPLPRIIEIAQEVDDDERAIYFEQAQNGLFIRMALLLILFDNHG